MPVMTDMERDTERRAHADPGELYSVTPAFIALSRHRGLVADGGLLCRIRLVWLNSGVRPRAIEYVAVEIERRPSDGTRWPFVWAGATDGRADLDRWPDNYLVACDGTRPPDPVYRPCAFEPRVVSAYETVSLMGHFVGDASHRAVEPGIYRATMLARFTGDGGIERTLGIVDVTLTPSIVSGLPSGIRLATCIGVFNR